MSPLADYRERSRTRGPPRLNNDRSPLVLLRAAVVGTDRPRWPYVPAKGKYRPGAVTVRRFGDLVTRYLRREGSPGIPESDSNGRYYDKLQIPVARDDDDKVAMLKKYLGSNVMIELLVHGDLALPEDVEVQCFSEMDLRAQDRCCNPGCLDSLTGILQISKGAELGARTLTHKRQPIPLTLNPVPSTSKP